jgi:thiol-disulfide isomerase/thioredoxin
MSSLKLDIQGGRVALSGILDENSDLKPLRGLTGAVLVNFKDVKRINSCGVREWVNLLGAVPGTQMTYEECPVVIVKQLNAVPDFQGKAKVASFFAPYFCKKCKKQAAKLIQASQVKDGKSEEPKCETCGEQMKFDSVPGQFFSFLKRGAP